MSKILRIQTRKIPNKVVQKVPQTRLPMVSYMQRKLFAPDPIYMPPQNTEPDFFSGLKRLAAKAVSSLYGVTSAEDSVAAEKARLEAEAAAKAKREAEAAEQARREAEAAEAKLVATLRLEYNELYSKCKRLYSVENLKHTLPTAPSYMSSNQLKSEIADIKAEISYQEMVADLEKKFVKGAEFYLSNGGGNDGDGASNENPFEKYKLVEIVPSQRNSYKDELKRLCGLYLDNSVDVEPAMLIFKELSRNYFVQAGKSMKEIFDLKNDTATKWLERIPKIGLITKALRVKDQIKLSKCVLKDYEDISKKYVQNGIMPIFNHYEEGYKTIEKYIVEHSAKTDEYKEYTNSYLKKIKEAREKRIKTNNKMLDIFATNGYNLVKSCDKVKKDGSKELIKKTLFTLVSLF